MTALLLLPIAAAAILAPASSVDLGPIVQEAAEQTGVPEPVLWAVIGVESNASVRALSPKGAMGAMQLMPGTWARLRSKLHLGIDPFDAHDNILAGAVYLRFLYGLYGWDGVFAAYNAGPGRYESHRDRGQSLPLETQGYVGRIAKKLAGRTYVFGPARLYPTITLWTEADIFVDVTVSPTASTDPFTPPQTPFTTGTEP